MYSFNLLVLFLVYLKELKQVNLTWQIISSNFYDQFSEVTETSAVLSQEM